MTLFIRIKFRKVYPELIAPLCCRVQNRRSITIWSSLRFPALYSFLLVQLQPFANTNLFRKQMTFELFGFECLFYCTWFGYLFIPDGKLIQIVRIIKKGVPAREWHWVHFRKSWCSAAVFLWATTVVSPHARIEIKCWRSKFVHSCDLCWGWHTDPLLLWGPWWKQSSWEQRAEQFPRQENKNVYAGHEIKLAYLLITGSMQVTQKKSRNWAVILDPALASTFTSEKLQFATLIWFMWQAYFFFSDFARQLFCLSLSLSCFLLI